MTNCYSFEYYSTFAPISGAFLADEPHSTNSSAFNCNKSLLSIDRGYEIYSNKTRAQPNTSNYRK